MSIYDRLRRTGVSEQRLAALGLTPSGETPQLSPEQIAAAHEYVRLREAGRIFDAQRLASQNPGLYRALDAVRSFRSGDTR